MDINELNPQQQDAVLNSYEGNSVVIAGAGSGKSRVVVNRIQHMLENLSVEAENIMVVTFTNKAAAELKHRISYVTEDIDKMWIGTFHSICVKILKKFGSEIGIYNYTIMSSYDSKSVIKKIMENNNMPIDKALIANTISRISKCKNNLSNPTKMLSIAKDDKDVTFAKVYQEYQDTCWKRKSFDFDDLIVYTVVLLIRSVATREWFQKNVLYMMVDEFQDTNSSQFELIKLIIGANNLFLVGDADQCWSKDNKVTTNNGVKRVDKLLIGDEVLSIKKHKIVMSKITNITKKIATTFKVTTSLGKKIMLTGNHKCFASRPEFNKGKHYVYLMYRSDKGFRLGTLTGGIYGTISSRAHSEQPDRLWILGMYDNTNEATLQEEYLSLRYRVPTNPFFHNGRSLALDQTSLNQMFSWFGSNGYEIIKDFELQFDYPNYIPKGKTSKKINRKTINLLMNSKKSGNEVSYESGDISIRKCFANFKEADIYAHKLKEEVNADIIYEKFSSLDGTLLDVIPVSQLTVGTSIPVIEDGKYVLDKIISIEIYKENDTVYDIEVEDTGILIANDIVTHNCIFDWRGAKPEYLLNFEQYYDNTKTFKLEQNYRSTKVIVEASNCLINNNKVRLDRVSFSKKNKGDQIVYRKCKDHNDEANWIAAEIIMIASQNVKFKDIAILFRTNSQSRALEEALAKYSIPCVVVGTLRYFDRKEVKDILSFLKIKVNPLDEDNFVRSFSLFKGVGDKTVSNVVDYSKTSGLSLVEALNNYPDPKKHAFAMTTCYQLLSSSVNKPSEFIALVIKTTGYKADLITEDTVESKARIENLEELYNLAIELEAKDSNLTIEDFINKISLTSGSDTENKDGSVSLMTLHSSKGLEFSYVFMAGMEDNLLPHANAYNESSMEAERRLAYVGVTRAKVQLYFTNAKSRMQFGGGWSSNSPSRFIKEIPSQYIMEV